MNVWQVRSIKGWASGCTAWEKKIRFITGTINKVRFIGLVLCYLKRVNKNKCSGTANTRKITEVTTMTTALTVSFILIGIIGFLQVADDLNVWVRIDKLCKKAQAVK